MAASTRSAIRRRYLELRAFVEERRARPLHVVRAPECQLPGVGEVAAMRTAIDLLHECGWQTYHETDSRRSFPGFPDLWACRPPRLLVVEFKVGDNTLDPLQRKWRDDLEATPGVEYLVCYLDQPLSWRRFVAVALDGDQSALVGGDDGTVVRAVE